MNPKTLHPKIRVRAWRTTMPQASVQREQGVPREPVLGVLGFCLIPKPLK